MSLTVEQANARCQGQLPGLLGIEIVELEHGRSVCRLPIRPELLATNGHLHGGTVTALADTGCGFGSYASLPEGATGLATIELKTSFIGTASEGVLVCTSTLEHGGRTTQVWDARVVLEDSHKTIALFRCTQFLFHRDI